MLKYDVEVKKFSELKDKIEIPKFQRGLVWSVSKKKEFIKTLKEGLPIGVLLLAPRDNKYLVIDGLQRYTTMLSYSNDYFSFIDKTEISDFDLQMIIYSSQYSQGLFDNYVAAAKAKQFEDMRKIMIDEMVRGKGKNLNQISSNITKRMTNEIAIMRMQDYAEIQQQVYVVIEKIENKAKIDDIEIPLIIFKGSENDLSNIFQKLNQEGVKLSKYDVFAATWLDHFVTVKNDPDFIDFIINKYEISQNESDLDIADYDPDQMKQTGKLTVFEYAFALGKAIMAKCDKLFGKIDDGKIESIGFLIMAELMGLSYQGMGNLAETCDKYVNLDFKKFKDAIIESAQTVQSSLGVYITSPYEKKGKRSSLCCHSELQLASYIIVLFKLKYELSIENGLVQKPNYKKINEVKNYLYRHYLFDIIRGYWSGSGDSKLEEIILDPETCRYTKDVDKNEFEMAIMSWLGEYNNKQLLKNITNDAKLFLNYLIRITDIPVEKGNYDVEHCVPKDLLTSHFIKKDILVPISSPCNLVYIPTKDNRSKGELTYYQRQKKEPGTFVLDEIQLDKMCYPSKTELSFTDSVTTITEQNYRKYLEERRKSITNRFISLMYK